MAYSKYLPGLQLRSSRRPCSDIDSKSHQCDYPGCDKKFYERRTLLRHQTKKHGRTPTKSAAVCHYWGWSRGQQGVTEGEQQEEQQHSIGAYAQVTERNVTGVMKAGIGTEGQHEEQQSESTQ